MKEIKREPLVADAAKEIRAAILDGRLIPGSRIAQDELATQLGVSRLPIRQALLMLEHEGLVLLDHGRGASVAPLDVKFISDLFDFRSEVDGHVAATLAARKSFDPAWLISLVQEGRDAATTGLLRQDLSMRFHTGLYAAVGNQVLLDTMEPLLFHVRRVVKVLNSIRHSELAPPERLALDAPALRSSGVMWDEHAAIADAITAHRVRHARGLARDHVQRVREAVLAYLSAGTGSSEVVS